MKRVGAIMESFGSRLSFLRNKMKKNNAQWTQGYVADRLGIARTTYTAYERDTKQPPMETINKIADLFGVSTDYLLGRTNQYDNDEVYKSSILGKEIELSQEEYIILKEIKKNPIMFNDLKNNPEKKVKQLIKMWKFIKEDIENANDDEDIIDD